MLGATAPAGALGQRKYLLVQWLREIQGGLALNSATNEITGGLIKRYTSEPQEVALIKHFMTSAWVSLSFSQEAFLRWDFFSHAFTWGSIMRIRIAHHMESFPHMPGSVRSIITLYHILVPQCPTRHGPFYRGEIQSLRS